MRIGLRGGIVAVALCALTSWLLLENAVAFAASPTIVSESVVEVSSNSAVFRAQLNPEGSETTYRFEYGTSVAYGTSVPVPSGLAGSGSIAVNAQAQAQDLQQDTTYHYRVTAVNSTETVYGPDQSFTTQSVGSGFVLPDNRAYEMVSPPQKDGAEVDSLHTLYESSGGAAIQASESGNAISYMASAPMVPEPPGNSGAPQVLSSRGRDGWISEDISTPHDEAARPSIGEGQEYRLFSSDLSSSVVLQIGPTPIPVSSEAPSGVDEIYLRNDLNGDYRPLITTVGVTGSNHFLGASPDLSHLTFSSGGALTPEAQEVEGGAFVGGNLYEWSAEGVKLVNVLPDGSVTAGEANLGYRDESVRQAVSRDGSRVVWSTSTYPYRLYSRDMVTGKTVQLDAAHGGTEEGEGIFQIASSDGSIVFFTDQANLVSGASQRGEQGELYAFDVKTGKLVDLTEGQVEGARVVSVLGASEDGSYVYFVAKGNLAGGAVDGQNNLYLSHLTEFGWTTRLVATLSAEDREGIGNHETEKLAGLDARVSPNGHYLAFMSNRSLTGYDNLDANSGSPDEEVYLYDTVGERHLVCASCNPTGARPVGEFDGGLGKEPRENEPPMNPYGNWDGVWLAASLPGWVASQGPGALAMYQPRYLSDGGRLFFDSADALVSQDTNGVEDVYEYEPEAVGGCQGAGGCVDMITPGTGNAASVFMDASGSGDDVFFMANDRILPQDFDAAYDVYDAHICSPEAPCIAPSPVPSPPCSTGDSCKAAPTPQPAIFGTPPSATFSGAGNVSPSNTASVIKAEKRKKARKPAPRKRHAGKRIRKKARKSTSVTTGAERSK